MPRIEIVRYSPPIGAQMTLHRKSGDVMSEKILFAFM